MKRYWLASSVLMLAALAIPGGLTAQAIKGANPQGGAATDADYKALLNMKEITGKIVGVGAGKITLRYEYQVAAPAGAAKANPGAKNNNNNGAAQKVQQAMQKVQQDQQKLQQAQAQLQNANPKQRQQQMQQLQKQKQQLQQDMQKLQQAQAQAAGGGGRPNIPPQIQNPNFVTTYKDFDLDMTDKVVLRMLKLPFEYDNDTGLPKVYTKADEAKLKGPDSSKPGYVAKESDLATGQLVKLSLVKPTAPIKKDADKVVDMTKPLVAMVLIAEVNAASAINVAPAKKKAK